VKGKHDVSINLNNFRIHYEKIRADAVNPDQSKNRLNCFGTSILLSRGLIEWMNFSATLQVTLPIQKLLNEELRADNELIDIDFQLKNILAKMILRLSEEG
jgi:hypothetical protein